MSDQEEDGARAVIEDGHIVIRVAVDALPAIVEGAWAAGGLAARLKVTDAAALAREIAHELNREDEDGTTLIHKMFDAAIDEAANQGAEGIAEHEEQDA